MDSESVYEKIGLFVVLFQEVENRLSQIACTILDPNHTGRGRVALAGRSFKDLVRTTSVLLAKLCQEVATDAAREKAAQFKTLCDRCERLATHRNELVHSSYLHIESGDDLIAVVRCKGALRMGSPGPRFELKQEQVTATSLDESLKIVADLAFELGVVHVQVIQFQCWLEDHAAP